MWMESAVRTVLSQINVQFIVQLLICEYIFFFRKEKRSQSKLRYFASVLVLFGVSWLFAVVVVNGMDWDGIWFSVVYLTYTGMLYCWTCFNYDILPMEGLFIIAGGYATEHMAYTGTKIVSYCVKTFCENILGIAEQYALWRDSLLYYIITRYVVYLICAWLVYCCIVKKNVDKVDFREKDYKIVALSLLLMVTAVFLSQSYTSDEYTGTYLGEVVCPLYGFICCLLVLIMVYYVLWAQKMQWEHESMEQMIQIAQNQQKSTREAIDIINIKCHDLKHQIQALGRMDEEKERKEYIEEIKDAVSIYDAVYHTGNDALDYVLREKTLISGEYNIKFTTMANGSLLDFIHAADIYALMSNAIDNAFESVVKEPEEKRIVSLQIKQQGKMITIHLENWCSEQPVFSDGLPLTQKSDKNQHGFGVRSIRYIAEKYNGEVMMRVQDHFFYLDVFFPMQKNK